MRCDTCQRKMNYCFYIDREHWRKAVGEQRFQKNQGHLCAHCTLERLGGLDWRIVWNGANTALEATTGVIEMSK